MAKKVVITEVSHGVASTIETVVSDDATAREFERLPFEVGHVVNVTVTDADEGAGGRR